MITLKTLKRIEDCQKNKEENLNLANLGLKKIPKEISNFVWLKSLSLNNNEISEVEGIENLVNLEKLDLSRNKISRIEALEKLVNLTELDFNANKISQIIGLDNLSNLTILNLNSNNITQITGLDNLVNLSKLFLGYNEINQITGLNNLVNISKLNLSVNNIIQINELDNLVNLTELRLSDNKIGQILGLNNLYNLSILDLSNNEISQITGLDNLTNLLKLYLNDNKISLIQGLDNLSNLSELYLNRNKISKISSLLNLSNLWILDLTENKIIQINGLDKLSNLSRLYLSNNQINQINGLKNTKHLSELYLENNKIGQISGLDTLINLKELILSFNKISKIDGLDNLINLSGLYLNNNKIIEIVGLDRLMNLSILDLSVNEINHIKGLDNLVNIIVLDLSNNKISKIEGLNKINSLYELHLERNNITQITGLNNLINLSLLNLSNNKINVIEGLDNLVNISNLKLSNNQIIRIEGFDNLLNINRLSIENNPLNESYSLVLKPGENHWVIIKTLIERYAEGGTKIKIKLPVKILLLGNHASGKSSLMHYLQYNNLKYKGDSTHLLNIELYPFDSEKPDAIFYDFGGQDFYHGIYRTFLSIGAAYILLWNKSIDDNKTIFDSSKILTQNFKINYWIGQKRHFEKANYEPFPDPLLLVQTHANINEKPTFIKEDIHENIENRFFVSLSDKYNPIKNQLALQHLKSEIEDLINSKKVEKYEQEWYVNFFEFIINDQNPLSTNIESLLTLYCPKNEDGTLKIKEEALVSLSAELELFHNQGLVLFYPDINPKIVWLNPAGLVQYIHHNILQKKIINKFKGIVPNEILLKFDQSIIALLKEQKVVFEHKWGNKGGIEFIIPNFLPLANSYEADYDLYTFGLNKPSFVLKFKDFLPIGLINQLICYFGQQPDKKKFWRDQLLFTFEKKCKVLIRLDFEQLKIEVYCSFLDAVSCQEQENINKYLFYCIMAMYWDLDIIDYNKLDNLIKKYNSYIKFNSQSYDDVLEKTFNPKNEDIKIINQRNKYNMTNIYSSYYKHSSFKKIFEIEDYISQDLYVSRNDKNYILYSELRKHDENKTKISSHKITSDGFLDDKREEIPVKPFEIFTNKKMTAMKKVFISYSKDDLSMVHRFRDALIPLYDDGIIENPWYCTFLEAGSNWDKEIQQKLIEADIVFFMCSMSFIRTKYIREHEIKTAIELNKTIIPVIINFCEWDNYLGEYTALPYTTKPVADFKNHDLAWLLVTKGIRWSLETDETKKEELNKQVRQLYERLVEGKLDI